MSRMKRVWFSSIGKKLWMSVTGLSFVGFLLAHLAGAMAKPVWMLLHSPGDWRWMDERRDSPWYPTLRIFRQKEKGDWAGVMDDVRAALKNRLRERD